MSINIDFGQADGTLRALGGEPRVFELVEAFYQLMSTQERYQSIWGLHERQLPEAEDRLARFLIGWMGGPRRYSERYGALSIPGVHAHLPIFQTEADLWLDCMGCALEQIGVEEELSIYLLAQMSQPAQRIVEVCAKSNV